MRWMRGEGKEVFGVRLDLKDKGGFEMWHKEYGWKLIRPWFRFE